MKDATTTEIFSLSITQTYRGTVIRDESDYSGRKEIRPFRISFSGCQKRTHVLIREGLQNFPCRLSVPFSSSHSLCNGSTLSDDKITGAKKTWLNEPAANAGPSYFATGAASYLFTSSIATRSRISSSRFSLPATESSPSVMPKRSMRCRDFA